MGNFQVSESIKEMSPAEKNSSTVAALFLFVQDFKGESLKWTFFLCPEVLEGLGFESRPTSLSMSLRNSETFFN